MPERTFDRIMQDYFQGFPSGSRVWVYQADKPFPDDAKDVLQPKFDAFTRTWTAHKQQLRAEMRLVHNFFIVLMLDENDSAGGCSIDTSVHFIKEIGKDYGIDLLDRMRVCFIHNGRVSGCSANEFINRLHAGEFSQETIVFNTLAATKEELLHRFTIPVKESWLKRYL